ncbi:MAG: hypothetical protein U0793_08665 [Gemmataceae bacterium]
MRTLHWSLLLLSLTVAAGYGGWLGPDLWSGWGVWLLLLLPIAWGTLTALREWRRGMPLRFAVILSGFGAIALGAALLGLAWAVAEGAGRWSLQPAVRALVGAGFGAAGGGLAWLYATSRRRAEPRETSASAGADGGSR